MKRGFLIVLSIILIGVNAQPKTQAADSQPTPVPTSSPQSGTSRVYIGNVTGISLSKLVAIPGEKITVEFEITAAQNADQKYGVSVSFSGVRLNQTFEASAELVAGNFKRGNWRAIVSIPLEVFSDTYSINFKGKGPGNAPELQQISNVLTTMRVNGNSTNIYPYIQILEISTDKITYLPGENVIINFQSTILSGAINQDTYPPVVIIKDVKSNSILYSTPRTKPPVASGSYESGRWTATYKLPQDMLSTQAQVEIRYPGRNEITGGTEKGPLFMIQSLKPEVKIIDVKLNKTIYLPNDTIEVTFKTFATDLTLNESNRPFLILTDYEYSDLSPNIPTILVSGNLNSGIWKAEIPNLRDGDYLFAFHNKERSIRETGPVIKIRTGNKTTITCTKGKTTKKVSGSNPKCPKGYKVKA